MLCAFMFTARQKKGLTLQQKKSSAATAMKRKLQQEDEKASKTEVITIQKSLMHCQLLQHYHFAFFFCFFDPSDSQVRDNQFDINQGRSSVKLPI